MENQRHLFSLDNSEIYLNGAYMSPQLKSVEAIGIESLRRKNNPGKILPPDFFTGKQALKQAFAKLIHAQDPNDIAIIPSVSYGMASVAKNISLGISDEILLVQEQFPSNVYCWQRKANEFGATIKTIKAPTQFINRAKQWNEAILSSISSKTAVVSIAHVHWADGTIFDLQTIGETCKKHNCLLIIDGTQSVGAMPIDVDKMHIDALVCGGYKWLLGPYSIGVSYISKKFHEGVPIEENWQNRKESEIFSNLTNYQPDYQSGAERFSVGESSNFILTPMLTKAIEQLIEWTPKAFQKYCNNITASGIEKLRSAGYFIEKDAWRAKHLFGIYLPQEKDINQIKTKIADSKIRVSYRGNAIRISPSVYNTEEDIQKLVNCLI